MPITIEPTPTTITVQTEQQFTANALWVDKITIDGSTRDLTQVGVQIDATPYSADASGNPTAFGTAPTNYSTKNLVAATVNIPALAAAYQAIEQGVEAWAAYNVLRQADLSAANTSLETAQANAATAQATLDAAFATRTNLYIAIGSTDAAVVDANAPYMAAHAAWDAANTAMATAMAAVNVAQANVTTATAALADPANPAMVTT